MKNNPYFSKEHAEGGKSCKFALPYSLAMDIGEG
jgi:hypothetical protein